MGEVVESSWSWWPECGLTHCDKIATEVDCAGVGYCEDCAELPSHPARSLHSFCPIWLMDTFFTSRSINVQLAPGISVVDLFYHEARGWQYPNGVYTGPLDLKEQMYSKERK